MTRANGDDLPPSLRERYPASSLLRGSPPLTGASVLSVSIAHLNKGLELVAALPPSAERDGSELDLRTRLGTAWMALRGWQAQEVWDNLHRALGLANALCRYDALLPIFWGLFLHVLTRGRVAESRRWVTQLMNAAETYRVPDLPIVGHLAAMLAGQHRGDPIKAREHADRVLALYSKEQHGHLAGILNIDPKTISLIFLAHSTWILGYPEQSLRILDAGHDHGRQVGHPFALAWALTIGAHVFDYLGEPDEWLKRIEEGIRPGGRERRGGHYAQQTVKCRRATPIGG